MGDVRMLLYKPARGNAFEVFVPQIALGGIFTVICRDCRPGGPHPRDMAAKIGGHNGRQSHRPGARRSAGGGAFGIMLQLREADKMLDPTDAVTVSHAPADGHSKFFTADGTMLGNREMIGLEKRLTPT